MPSRNEKKMLPIGSPQIFLSCQVQKDDMARSQKAKHFVCDLFLRNALIIKHLISHFFIGPIPASFRIDVFETYQQNDGNYISNGK